ncbi:MAG: DUF1801 domain-containing protein [Candidatus Doudnabacteria bacterium]
MFKKVKANSVGSYLKAVPKDRQEAVLFLHNFIKKTVPKLKPHFAYNMLGYGSFKVRNYKKNLVDWPTIALANQKNYISLYICAVDHGQYIAEKNKKELGKVSVGKSCIRFKKAEDLNLPGLQKVLLFAQRSPGLAGVGARK